MKETCVKTVQIKKRMHYEIPIVFYFFTTAVKGG